MPDIKHKKCNFLDYQGMGHLDHKHGKIGTVVDRRLLHRHEIFQAPILFRVPEIALQLETQPILIGKYLSRLRQFDQVIALQERFEAQLQAPRLAITFGMRALGMTG
jgi:hypothetical protein